jgi:hypothetical protein
MPLSVNRSRGIGAQLLLAPLPSFQMQQIAPPYLYPAPIAAGVGSPSSVKVDSIYFRLVHGSFTESRGGLFESLQHHS